MEWIAWLSTTATGIWALAATLRYARLRRKHRALRRRYGEALRQLELAQFAPHITAATRPRLATEAPA